MTGLGGYLEDMLSRAYSEAKRHGRLIGRVSRYSAVKTEPGGRVRVEVDPEVYYTVEGPHRRVGDYLVIIDPKTLNAILARVAGITRMDEVAGLGVEPPLSPYSLAPDPPSLLTLTFIDVEPLLEAPLHGSSPPSPAVSAIEPQSPVIDPGPGLLERLLHLPGAGVVLGSLASPGGLVKEGMVPVRLPLKVFLQHVLIIGTTGSGKTTLMKNMAASMTGLPEPPLLVVMDLNQDFIQLPLGPLGGLPRDPVYERVYRGVNPPGRITALTPITLDMARGAVENGASDIGEITLGLARMHYEDTLKHLTGEDVEWIKAAREGAPMAYSSRISFIPYAIDTTRLPTDSLLSLLPGLTSLSRETLRRIRERFKKMHGRYPPLQALYAAMVQYTDRRRDRSSEAEEELVVDMLLPYIVSRTYSEAEVTTFALEGFNGSLLDIAQEVLGVIKAVRPHPGSIEALHRRIGAVLDSGMADILVSIPPGPGGRVLRVFPEPGWETISRVALEARAPVVVDLGWSAAQGLGGLEGSRLAAYRILESLISWRQRLWAARSLKGSSTVVVFIDEAHQFFPQERGAREEAEANRQVASMIARIARLGRARGLGLVFSTHSPKDLHDIILQLANTRIILRTERGHAERLDLPSDLATLLPRLPDRTMIVASHAYREGYVLAQTSLPIVAHYDASAQ